MNYVTATLFTHANMISYVIYSHSNLIRRLSITNARECRHGIWYMDELCLANLEPSIDVQGKLEVDDRELRAYKFPMR